MKGDVSEFFIFWSTSKGKSGNRNGDIVSSFEKDKMPYCLLLLTDPFKEDVSEYLILRSTSIGKSPKYQKSEKSFSKVLELM